MDRPRPPILGESERADAKSVAGSSGQPHRVAPTGNIGRGGPAWPPCSIGFPAQWGAKGLSVIYFLAYPVIFAVFRLLLRVLGRARATGEHFVPRTGPVIYCPNHMSDADPPTVFLCVPRRAWFIAKSELFEIPVLGKFFAHFHGIPIKRDSADRAALRRAEGILKRGEAAGDLPGGPLLPGRPTAAHPARRGPAVGADGRPHRPHRPALHQRDAALRRHRSRASRATPSGWTSARRSARRTFRTCRAGPSWTP